MHTSKNMYDIDVAYIMKELRYIRQYAEKLQEPEKSTRQLLHL